MAFPAPIRPLTRLCSSLIEFLDANATNDIDSPSVAAVGGETAQVVIDSKHDELVSPFQLSLAVRRLC